MAGYVPNYTTVGNDVTIKNKKNDNPTPITPDEVIVVPGGIKFVKNGDSDARLADATFIIQDTIGEVTSYLIQDAATGAVTWAAIKDDATLFVSDKNGFFEIKGLEYSTTTDTEGNVIAHSYALVETVAPTGYALSNTPFGFTIKETSYSSGDIASVIGSAKIDATEVENKLITIPRRSPKDQ